MLSYQLEDFIPSKELVRYHQLGGGVLFPFNLSGDWVLAKK